MIDVILKIVLRFELMQIGKGICEAEFQHLKSCWRKALSSSLRKLGN